MSGASDGIWGARCPAVRWMGLTAFVLLAACGGERSESANAGTGGAAATDSAPTASADTVAMATGDSAASTDTATSTAGATRDTTAKEPAQRPAAPAAPAKPAAPATPAKPATPAAPAQDTARDTARDTAAPRQDTTATTPPDTGAGETETANAPLRDQYHQAPRDTVDQATYDGWKQYNLNCARCHGEDVLGSTIAPHLVLSLKPDGPINTPEKFTQTVCAGRPERGMPSWCALGMDPAKIGQIYSYVKGRSEGKIHPGRPAVKPEG
jgi:cbb3-type cytochrome c oxidase subunit III